MPKLARRAALLSAALFLTAPAVAAAQDFTVDPAVGGTACEGARCPTIQSAVAAASPGDRIDVLAGTYPESVAVAKELTIRGAGAGVVKVTGKGTGDVLRLTSAGITVSGLTVDVPGGGGSAVVVTADGVTLSDLVAQRANPSSVDAPVIAITGGASILKSFVVQNAGGASPGVASDGTGGVALTDTFVVSSSGPAVVISESAANRVVRSTIASTAKSADGLRFDADDSAADKALVLDSSFVIAGAGGTALSVRTTGAAAGDVTVSGRHLTASGTRGVLLDSSGAQASGPQAAPSGNISGTFTSSIVHGASEAKRYAATLPILQTSNQSNLTFASSDAPPATGNGTITMGGASNTPDAALFAPGSLRLRADAPVIDKGGAPAGDESDKDVEGEPRVNGAASDIGADEFHNKRPVAKFGIANPQAGVNQDVGFISGSTDPEQDAGGGIVEYRWDFGDGNKQTTKDLGVVHKYDRVGSYHVTLQVVDRQGGVSDVSPAQVVTIAAVVPGVGPTLRISVPGKGQRVRLKGRGKRQQALRVLGSWADPEGIKSIEVSLRLVKKERRRARSSQSSTCTYYSGRRLSRVPCAKALWVPARIKPTGFELRTRRGVRLPRGRYHVSVRGTDKAGNASAAPSTAARTLVSFRIR